jgi:hypothetical protein
MPAGPEETDNHPAGSITEQIAKNPTSKTESTASDHPHHTEDNTKGEQVQFRHHEANPGPAVPKDFNVKEEGTKAERQARTAALNN